MTSSDPIHVLRARPFTDAGEDRHATVLSRDDYQMLVLPEPTVLDSEMQASLRWSLGSMIEYPAAEASLALGLVVLLFRTRQTLDADAWRDLKG